MELLFQLSFATSLENSPVVPIGSSYNTHMRECNQTTQQKAKIEKMISYHFPSYEQMNHQAVHAAGVYLTADWRQVKAHVGEEKRYFALTRLYSDLTL